MQHQADEPESVSASRVGGKRRIGYCLNIHPGTTLDAVKSNLETHTLEVKRRFRPDAPLGVGLWLSDSVSRELCTSDDTSEKSHRAAREFADWLAERELIPFTLNGFPFDDFHQPIVKHNVYLPTWADSRRLDYTLRLAAIQSALLPASETHGTISTLPLGWNVPQKEFLSQCADQLRRLSEGLSVLENETGKSVFVAIEPEPGCVLDRATDVTWFFEQHLLTGQSETDSTILKHIGVCHDVCHSAVMFEAQEAAISAYTRAGIRVGKVQVSSAIEVDFESSDPQTAANQLRQLNAFAEPRYLHQTSIRSGEGVEFFDDLPLALAANERPEGVWRIHFHVPVFVDRFDGIGTTQMEIGGLMKAMNQLQPQTSDFEIETYAWNVMPNRLDGDSVAESVAAELKWFAELIDET